MSAVMSLTLEEIYKEFDSLDAHDQSQYLLELGYDLPRFSDSSKRDEDLVHGCQSQVWLRAAAEPPAEGESDPKIRIEADSDAEIVRGLIAILLASYSGRTASEILQFPIVDVFEHLKLRRFISPQRQNGLRGMVDRILSIAASHAASGVDASEAAVRAAPSGSVSAAPTRSDSNEEVQNTAPYDAEAVRGQFPVLMRAAGHGRPLAYLDSGASAQKPGRVIAKEREVEEQYFSNSNRGRYSLGTRIDEELDSSRAKIASFLGAGSTEEICFTSGTTAALNLIAFGWGRRHVRSGDEILINETEHHANIVPWQQLAGQTGAVLKYIPLLPDGRLDISRIDELIHSRTRIVSCSGMSNVLGCINPIAELSARAREVGACMVVDAAQSVPHMPVRVQDPDVDFLVFSGHKLYGPTGVGVLYGRRDRLEETDPILFGGHMVSQVTRDSATWAPVPAKLEAGTLPIVQAIALGEAVSWVESVGLQRIHDHEQSLLATAMQRLSQIDGLRIFGPAVEHRGAIVSFRVDGVHPEDLAAVLDSHGVCTRHGHHCAMPLHEWLKVSGTTRASFAAYNTDSDISQLVSAVEDAVARLRR